ncbi:uncharacterized protein VTP21DRAFT_2429 [Calcarisporiella thermophila]|uniref:uncharacterized protein n=1 Tax=Calcarisporiella thermophila TaxID=911321 RepID=UPI003742D413
MIIAEMPPIDMSTVEIATKKLMAKNAVSRTAEIYTLPTAEVLRLCVEQRDEAFFVADLGAVYRQDRRWKKCLPRIEPFYAVKCNPDPYVLKLMADFGNGFDCASKSEIQQVLELGVAPDRIIYANPCKQASYLRYAAEVGVRKLTFDNVEELHKIRRLHPDAELVLRILTDDSNSLCKLGLKFGAPLDVCPELLQVAKELGLNVVGVSFHVGSGCFDEGAFVDAIERARIVFDEAERLGFRLTLLDVGGGFPGDGEGFERVAAVLSDAVARHFPDEAVKIIGEPGRYYAAAAFTLATQVIARRTQPGPEYMYYINDGVYGSFNCTMFDHQEVHPLVLKRNDRFWYRQAPPADDPDASEEFACSVWGPTCDSIDCVTPRGRLPRLEVGDWVCYENMGAYTICAASRFNGFQKSRVVYTNTEPALSL